MVVASIRTRIDIPGCPSKTVAPLNLLSGYILVLPICTSFDLSRSKLLMYSSILVSFPGKSGKGGHSYALIKCCCFVLLLFIFFFYMYFLLLMSFVIDFISVTPGGVYVYSSLEEMAPPCQGLFFLSRSIHDMVIRQRMMRGICMRFGRVE